MRCAYTLRCSLAVAAVGFLLSAGADATSFDEADVDTERCLAEGKILKRQETLEGVTRPELFLIECDGAQRRVLVKTFDEEHRGLTRLQGGSWEMNFSDSYRYERAAYLLDRELGLNMVPVTVIRKVKREEAALVEWIDHASHLEDSPHKPTGTERAELARQKAIMHLFDALIFNTDRNTSNYLVDDENWRLYMIDHSRAFREVSEIPEGFTNSLARLPRELYQRLQGLEEESLVDLLDGSITRGQVRKMLERRDRILEKIDNDCQEVGDDVVFYG